MKIKKVDESVLVEGHVVDSLYTPSSVNAPSVDAVNKGIQGKVRYNNASGTNTHIIFGSSISDGDILEVHWSSHTGDSYDYMQVSRFHVKFGDDGLFRTNLHQIRIDANAVHIDHIRVSLNMSGIKIERARNYNTLTGAVVEITDFKIYKVIQH